MTTHDRAALLFCAVIVAVLLWLPVAADTCPGCMLPEPEPPISETHSTTLYMPFLAGGE